MIKINTPISNECINKLKIGDQIEIDGTIFSGRDAVLPRLVKLYLKQPEEVDIDLKGAIIFHTAVSPAGVGPTSSNKIEIENSIGPLSENGIKMHIGKGSLSKKTVELLKKYNSVYAITPPVTALLTSKIISREIVMFPEEGMEALHRLKVSGFPAIIAIAHGKSIFEGSENGENVY